MLQSRTLSVPLCACVFQTHSTALSHQMLSNSNLLMSLLKKQYERTYRKEKFSFSFYSALISHNHNEQAFVFYLFFLFVSFLDCHCWYREEIMHILIFPFVCSMIHIVGLKFHLYVDEMGRGRQSRRQWNESNYIFRRMVGFT